jgi:hypothetical protein
MILLWAFIIAADILALAAGVQAVSLLRSRDEQIARLDSRVVITEQDAKLLQNQMNAKDVLLEQARQWIKARMVNTAAATPSAAPASQK